MNLLYTYKRCLLNFFYNLKERYLFDILYGTETSSALELRHFHNNQNLKHGKDYYASSSKEIYKSHQFIFNLLQKKLEQFLFIDLGCGKGKVCIFWKLLNQKKGINQKIIGIDFYLPFIKIANQNHLKVFKKKGEFIHSNVQNFNFKETNKPLILYLFNPFDEVMLESILIKIKNIPVYIIYNIPMHWDIIEKYHYHRIFYKSGKNQNEFTFIYTNILANPELLSV